MTANQLGFDPPNRLRPEHQHHKMLEVRVLYREVQTLKVYLPITRGKSSLRPRLPGKEDRGESIRTIRCPSTIPKAA